MKKLVIFYSLEGNTAFVAEAIAEAIDAEILELKPKKDLNPKSFFTFFWGGMQVVFKIKPALMELDKNIENYDILFIGLWR
jgi:flavodoxin